MKEEALKLADILEGAEVPNDTQMFEASAMIRRLVAELSCANDYIKQYQFEIKNHKYDPATGEPLIDGYPLFSGLPRGKPLSDDDIIQLACDTFYGLIKKEERDNFIRFAKAIEERHWIK